MKKNLREPQKPVRAIKHTNICIIEVPKEDKKKEAEKIFEYFTKNFPSLRNSMNIHVQEVP